MPLRVSLEIGLYHFITSAYTLASVLSHDLDVKKITKCDFPALLGIGAAMILIQQVWVLEKLEE